MNSVALVTGAAGGIGRAIATRLAAAGHRVVGGDVAASNDPPDDLVEHVQLDVTDDAGVRSAVARASELGTLRVVVNCAAVLTPSRTHRLSDEELDRQIDVNLTGTVRVCRAVTEHLGPGSSVVNIGSIAATLGGARGVGIYAATKAGIEGFTRVLACELGPRGARANVVTPGFIDAPMAGMLRSDPDTEARIVASVPLHRLGRPEEIAEVVEFLASNRASYVTGATIRVDGGRVAC